MPLPGPNSQIYGINVVIVKLVGCVLLASWTLPSRAHEHSIIIRHAKTRRFLGNNAVWIALLLMLGCCVTRASAADPSSDTADDDAMLVALMAAGMTATQACVQLAKSRPSFLQKVTAQAAAPENAPENATYDDDSDGYVPQNGMPRLGSKGAIRELVLNILAETNGSSLQNGHPMFINFDYQSYVDMLLDDESLFNQGYGPCQGGKTSWVAVAWLVTFLSGRPFYVMLCHTIPSTTKLAHDVNMMMNRFLESEAYKTAAQTHASLRFEDDNYPRMLNMACKETRKLAKATMDAKPNSVRYGKYGFVTTHSVYHINSVKQYFVTHKMPRAVLLMDEADTFFTIPTDVGGCKREVAFWEFASAAKVDNSKITSLCKLVQFTATPHDVLAWHIANNNKIVPFTLDAEELDKSGYTTVADMVPFSMGDGAVFYDNEEVKKGLSYGWYDTSGSINWKTQAMYDSVEAARKDRESLLLLDMSNPLVDANDNMFQRAERVFTQLDFVDWRIIVVTGKGIYVVTWDNTNHVVVSNKVVLDGQSADAEPLSHTIHSLWEKDKSIPICVMGFTMMGRCLSVRGCEIVPTHMIVAFSKTATLSTIVQRFGRAQGRTLAKLGGHKVVVLAQEEIWTIMQVFHEFVTILFDRYVEFYGRLLVECRELIVLLAYHVAQPCVSQPSLCRFKNQNTDINEVFKEKFPQDMAIFWYITRNYGHKAINAKDVLGKRMRYASSSSSDNEDEEPVSTCERILNEKLFSQHSADFDDPFDPVFVESIQKHLPADAAVLQAPAFVGLESADKALLASGDAVTQDSALGRKIKAAQLKESEAVAGTSSDVGPFDDVEILQLKSDNRQVRVADYSRWFSGGDKRLVWARVDEDRIMVFVCKMVGTPPPSYIYHKPRFEDGQLRIEVVLVCPGQTTVMSHVSVRQRIVNLVHEHRRRNEAWSGTRTELARMVEYKHPLYNARCMEQLINEGYVTVTGRRPQIVTFVI